MPRSITNHSQILEAIRSVDIISELVERENSHFKYELDLEVIAYGRNYTGKKVGPYVNLLVFGPLEDVIRQGDWGGNSFYFLVDGKLDVLIKDASGESKKVNELQPGRSFGEMSVLAGVPRNATVRVPEGAEARVLKVARPALRLLRKLPKFGNAIDATYREYGLKRTLEDVRQMTQQGSSAERELFARLEKIALLKVYGKQHVMFRESAQVDRIAFIKSGWVRRSRGTGFSSRVADMMMEVDEGASIDFLGAGNCLGLEALAGNPVWNYTATVLTRTEVLEVSLAALKNDPELRAMIERTFAGFSLVEAAQAKQAISAATKEIGTGIIEGNNLLVMDMDLCVRCGNCSLACHKVHGQSRLLRRGIHIERPVKLGSSSTQHVLAPQVCLHCQDPECLTGCPTGAIGRFSDGQIDIDPKTCIGCGDCATQCPYTAITMIPRKPMLAKPTSAAHRLLSWFNLAPQELPPPVEEVENLLAVKCNLCNNTGLNPKGARRAAYSCQENCPTGALVRVNPREYFTEAGRAIGLVYRDQTHAIGRDIHKSDPLAKLWHAFGVLLTVVLTFFTVWAMRKYTLDGRLAGTWLTVRWITGLVGLVGIAAVMTYSGRKQVYRRRAGALRYWMLMHVYLGVVAGILLLLHGGSSAGGILTTTLMVSFDVVILTGLFGVACYIIVPRIMTSIEGDPLLIEDLRTRREELRETLATIDTSNAELHSLITGKVRSKFLTLSYLLRQYVRREPLPELLARAREQFEPEMMKITDTRARRQLVEVVESTATLRRVDSLIYLHQLLKLWLAPHVVSSALMLALMLVHIVQVVFFNVR